MQQLFYSRSNTQLMRDAPLRFFDRRELLFDRFNPQPKPEVVAVCVPGSQVYVVITLGIHIGGDAVKDLLENASLYILNIIMARGDGRLHNGMFNYPGMNQLTLQVWNANNHQVTYSVMGGALTALHNWMSHHSYSSASFGIYDGQNQVGNGVINGPAS